MNGRGEVLVVPANEQGIAHLYSNLDALFSQSGADSPPLRLVLPFSASNGNPTTATSASTLALPREETITALSSGSAHFLLLTSSSQVYSYGDSRYGQAGPFSSSSYHSSSSPSVPPAATIPLNHLSFFDGLYPVQLSCGSFHSAVRTREGSVYLFGSDEDGQCGGTGGGAEPEMVDLETEGEEADEEVVQVACGGAHTVLLTASGKVWVAGANHDGQLGLGDTAPRERFTRCSTIERLAVPHRVHKLLCSHSTTFFESAP
ncbi:hypothetical protein JCM10021v2_003724 [Rhodotorula toruloides]